MGRLSALPLTVPLNPSVCSSGRSRQLAFVGFKTVEQAIEAVRFYNHTFLDTSRIEVEVGAEER